MEYFRSIPISKIVSSPLKRATQTADYIALATGIGVSVDERFREIDVGGLEETGPTTEAREIYSRVTTERYLGNRRIAFPNGEDGVHCAKRFACGVASLRYATICAT